MSNTNNLLQIGDTVAIEDEQDGKLLAVAKVTRNAKSWKGWVHIEFKGITYKVSCLEFCLLDKGSATNWSIMVMNEGCKDSWPNASEYYS